MELGRDELAALISNAGIAGVVDVRSVPKSRRWPNVWREQMEKWVPELGGATYRLGSGARRVRKAKPDSLNLGFGEHPAGSADTQTTWRRTSF